LCFPPRVGSEYWYGVAGRLAIKVTSDVEDELMAVDEDTIARAGYLSNCNFNFKGIDYDLVE
jgi:hypothetical protein